MMKLPYLFNVVLSFATRFFGFTYKVLTKEEFLNLKIEPNDSYNWKWRAKHLNIVTNDRKFVIVKDIIDYLSSVDVINNIENSIKESVLNEPFEIPSNLDMDFWWSGNNYFWYCIKYKFRKNVIPYAEVNNYLAIKEKKHMLYSSGYYESLEIMNDDDIKLFLSRSLIEITDNSVTGGKHRVFAMIGRLLDGEHYIPFSSISIIKNK
jgi:hypothetical protein